MYISGAKIIIENTCPLLSFANKSDKILLRVTLLISKFFDEVNFLHCIGVEVGKLRYSPLSIDIMPKISKAVRGKHRWVGLVFSTKFSDINSLKDELNHILKDIDYRLYDYILDGSHGSV